MLPHIFTLSDKYTVKCETMMKIHLGFSLGARSSEAARSFYDIDI
jgi:hypothetical protein